MQVYKSITKTVNDTTLIRGDAIIEMSKLPVYSADLILTDLPYGEGATDCHWDKRIPFVPLWEQFKRMIKPQAVIALFCTQPFTSDLISSNREMYRYNWYWDKRQSGSFHLAPLQPLRVIEEIAIFSRLPSPVYYPQMEKGVPRLKGMATEPNKVNGVVPIRDYNNLYYPKSLITYPRERGLHATQKPTALLRYLIRTYTQKGQVVLDCCMGSGSTGEAAIQTGRKFIGIEIDPIEYNGAVSRLLRSNAE